MNNKKIITIAEINKQMRIFHKEYGTPENIFTAMDCIEYLPNEVQDYINAVKDMDIRM